MPEAVTDGGRRHRLLDFMARNAQGLAAADQEQIVSGNLARLVAEVRHRWESTRPQ